MPHVAPLPPKARGLRPVRAAAVVAAVAAALLSDEVLCARLGAEAGAGAAALGRSRIHARALPLDDETGSEASAAPVYVLVKQRARLDGAARPAGVAGQRPVRVHVLVSADPDVAADMADVVGEIHDRIYDALQGERVAGEGFALVEPLDRVDEPDEPMTDPRRDGDGRLYASAVYLAIAEPASPAY